MDDDERGASSGALRLPRGMVGGCELVGAGAEEVVSSGRDGAVLVVDGAVVVVAVSSGTLDSEGGSGDVRGFEALLAVFECVGPAFLGAGRV